MDGFFWFWMVAAVVDLCFAVHYFTLGNDNKGLAYLLSVVGCVLLAIASYLKKVA